MMVVYILAIFVLFCNQDTVDSATECGKLQPADIGFLMDESGSVGELNFQKNKDFITKFVDLFQIGDNAVKLSAFAFGSNDIGGGFHFACCSDKTSIKNSVNAIAYRSGGQNFEMALAFARESMFQTSNGARESALKILFFFTDGQSYVSTGGQILKQQGVLVYAIGVGSGVNNDQLNKIAYSNNYVFHSTDYNELIGSVFNTLISKACDEIVPNACDRTIPPCVHGTCINGGTNYICLCDTGYTGVNCEIDIDYCVGVECHHGGTCIDGLTDYTCQCPDRYIGRHCDIDMCKPFPSDVVFIVDSSTSINEKHFNISKNTVLKLTKEMEISPMHFQVAVMTKPDSYTMEIPFNESMSNNTFSSLVSDLKLIGGISELHHGLNFAKHTLINRNRIIGQTPVRKFIILLSDGLVSTPSSTYTMSGNDVEVLAVAIGEDVSHYWLSKITGSERLVFPYHDVQLWNHMVNTLVDQSCNVCQSSEENDLLFVVDTSTALTSTDLLNTVPSILNKMISGFTLGSSKSKVALITFSSKAEVIFSFNEFNELNRNDMQRQMSYFSQTNDTSANITAMLDYVSRVINNSSLGARPSAKKRLVILSGFTEKVTLNDKAVLEKLYNANVDVYTIGLHETNEEFDTMNVIATSAFHIGIDGGLYFNSIETFISSFHEQLQTLSCTL